MSGSEWRDLSGTEVVARLVNRNVPPATARYLVAHAAETGCRTCQYTIDKYLGVR